ncbi:phospho-N-acetylmuramoyl-pentapeptide-transferase [Ruminococcaceae bacterium YRB3002]|nr:phospho-N-acetylmuramoyl-pentapeptide-transferase [Ruminococcaceae bacterium YRB3002]
MDIVSALFSGILQVMIFLAPALIGFAATVILLKFLPFGKLLLGADRGRKFAVGSEVNIGKPTGVGFYFALVIAVTAVAFLYNELPVLFFMILSVIAMITGFLDDRAKNPWNEYVKGALDFVIALIGALIAVIYLPNEIIIGLTGTVVSIPAPLYYILAVLLICVSINATNATDGVDGLSGTLTVMTFLAFMFMSVINGTSTHASITICQAVVGSVCAYLIFNYNPSKMLMGDAGSRSLGLLIAVYAMYVRMPVAYLIICLPFLIDGGLSIMKITIGRLTRKKVIILKNTLTPIHDHLKKRMGFSVKKTMFTIVIAGLIVDALYIGITIFIHRM